MCIRDRSSPSRPFEFIRQRKVLIGLVALICSATIYFVCYVLFRSFFSSTYAGNQLATNFSLSKYFVTNLIMSFSAVPGLLPLFDFGQWEPSLLFSARGIFYNASSLFLIPSLVWLRYIFQIGLPPQKNSQFSESNLPRQLVCSVLAVYLFIAATSLPSLTSVYQSILLDHHHWGYLYTFLAFVVFAAFTPTLILKVFRSKNYIFWTVAIFLGLVSLFGRGYSQAVFDEMSSASMRWRQFEAFLDLEPQIQKAGCLRSVSLFQAAHLIDVTDDYWTRFAKIHKPNLIEGTSFIRDGKNYDGCYGEPGRFEFIRDSSNRHLGWYLESSRSQKNGRELLIFIERPVPLYVYGPDSLRDQSGNLYMPNNTKAIMVMPSEKRIFKYSMEGDDVSVNTSGFGAGQILQMLEGFYPRELSPHTGNFWWARGSSSFKLAVDPVSLPKDAAMRLVIVPVGGNSGSKLLLLCDKLIVNNWIFESQPEVPIEIDLTYSQLRNCNKFSLIPDWPELVLSSGDSRKFSFKLVDVQFYEGSKK